MDEIVRQNIIPKMVYLQKKLSVTVTMNTASSKDKISKISILSY
jgi:hypothetical protein